MVNVAIVGFGNVGIGVHKSLTRNPDMDLVGIVSRDPERVKDELGNLGPPIHSQQDILEKRVSLYDQITVDVAILCGGSRQDLPLQGHAFAEMFNTVDSFDTHSHISPWQDEQDQYRVGYFREMDNAARANNHTSVVCAGWDPGTFSVNRALLDTFLPDCVPKAFYGVGEKGGLSAGHSNAVRKIRGVIDARQYTHAIPEAMERVRKGENPDLLPEEMHWRDVKVVAGIGANKERIESEIRDMEGYYRDHRVEVEFVSQKELDTKYLDMPHDGVVMAVGETGDGNRAVIEYRNQFASNPEATGNILTACARAAHRLSKQGRYGAFTMLDLSPADVSPHSRETMRRKFM